ncbi:MAG TPA: hypothetical protein VGU46_09910 [Acidobacteriaceae bacterium]|nr:hypothetical protein [Acidobacteriaceae bacterium]
MKRLLIAAVVLAAAGAGQAQSVDDLNVQVHGYVTQGFIYTTHNNWNTTESTDGSPAWNDAVLNITAQPNAKLHIGVQGRYSLLGDEGNQITLDWAQLDYKVNDYFGVRAGKVKSPLGLYNETQDIDPAQLWILLPQSVYPLASRNALLAHYGGVVYGSLRLGQHMGKLQYRVFGGERVLAPDDGYFQQLRDAGLTVPNGISGETAGGSVRWETPVRGLMFGASEHSGSPSGAVTAGPFSGMVTVPSFRQVFYFGKYEKGRVTLASEFSRLQTEVDVRLTGLPISYIRADQHEYYVMGSYKATSKLSGGLYFGSIVDHRAAYTSSRYEKDWALSGRFDFNSFVYAKVEQHWIDGTSIGFSMSDNTHLQPTTKMTLLKMGVSF